MSIVRFSAYGGIPARKQDAIEKIAAVTALEARLSEYKTWLLERVRRGGFSYSDETESADECREAFTAIFGSAE